MSTPISYQEFLEDFRDTILSAKARLQDIPETQSSQKTSPADWSAKETIGHLIDSATNNHQRFVRAQFSDDLVFPGYAQEDWISAQKYEQEGWQDLVQIWSSYNLHLVH